MPKPPTSFAVVVPKKAPAAAPRPRGKGQDLETPRRANHGVPTADLKPLHFRVPPDFIERFDDAAKAAGRMKKNAFLFLLLEEYEARQARTASKGRRP